MNCEKYSLEVNGCSKQGALIDGSICEVCLAEPIKRPWILIRVEKRRVKATCSVCKGPVYDNVNPEKIITCAYCVQGLLMLSQSEKLRLRDTLLEKDDLEGSRSIESFILPEGKEEQSSEPTRKFRPAMERKRFMRKARPSYGENAVRNNRVLD